MRRLVLLLLLWVCPACGKGAHPAVAVEIGTGAEGFVPLSSVDAVDIIDGPQGGHHIWVSLRATGFSVDDGAVADLWVQLPSETHTAGGLHVRPPFRPVGDHVEAYGLTDFVDDPDRVKGQEVILGARHAAVRRLEARAQDD